MQDRSNRNQIISSYSHRHSIHFNLHSFYPTTLSTRRFFNRYHWMESHQGFSHDLGFCRYHTIGDAENKNYWFNTSFYSPTTSLTDHGLDEILGRRNYR